jgi:hypothetical protein
MNKQLGRETQWQPRGRRSYRWPERSLGSTR